MQFQPPLQPATLIQRYKRFLADIRFADGEQTTVHCANTGAMTGCADAGNRVWVSDSGNSKRKYPLSWILSENSHGQLICVQTTMANSLVAEALAARQLLGLADYDEVRSEVRYGVENSRADFALYLKGQLQQLIEVKSVTLLRNNSEGLGEFPDAKTSRGQKHLRELSSIVEQGVRSALIYVAMHQGISKIAVARDIDPEYYQLFSEALAAGVEFYGYRTHISAAEIVISEPVTVCR